MVKRADHRNVDEPRRRKRHGLVDMNEVNRSGRIMHSPRRVVIVFELSSEWISDWPLRGWIQPSQFAGDMRLAVGVHDHVMTALEQATCELGSKQFGSAVCHRRNGNK